ncbi:MAG: PilW family protein [Motiliproteus sp.]|nr:PilW family protein [Motiliproteus sp.]
MNSANHLSPKRQRGLSLVELMIALVVSSMLMLGVFQIFLGSSNTDRVARSYARIQENGRLAMDILTRNIRMAGYQGCIDPALIDMNIIADDPPTIDLSNDGIMGYESDSTAWNVANRNDDLDSISGIPNGSDIVYVQYVSPSGVNVVCNGNGITSCEAVNANIKIDDNSVGLNKYDVAIVSDCENADMFRIVNMVNDEHGDNHTTLAHSNSHNSSNNLSKPYDEDAQVMTFEALAYYVKDTGRNNSHGEDIYSLYHFDSTYHAANDATITGREQELVEGIEQLQILYGERLASGNMRFVPADTSSLDFGDVEAVRLSILVSATEPVLQDDDSETYLLPGADVEPLGASSPETVHPADKRLRQVFTTTIYLRNLGT